MQTNTRTSVISTKIQLQLVRINRCHFIFDYNFDTSWSILIIFAPVETGMNTT